MKIFVSSRMDLLLERKSAIDAVHLAGHRPLYIEAEQYQDVTSKKTEADKVEGYEKLRSIMLRMIGQADAFIGIYQDKRGTAYPHLGGQTAIQFELNNFLDSLQSRDLLQDTEGRVLLFRGENAETDWVSSILHARQIAASVRVTQYREYVDIISQVFDRVKPLHRSEGSREEQPSRPEEVTIGLEYHGKDHAGLLRVISEFLFTEHGMNIDHVWGSTRGKNAMLNLSAYWYLDDNGSESRPDRGDLETALREEVARLFDLDPSDVPLSVGDGYDEIAYGYVEVRTIDAPGQLNTICKAIKNLDLNIAQIRLDPAPPEFPRQTVIALTVPLDRREERLSRRAQFLKLEAKLRDLVGVRAISTRFSRPLSEA